MSRPSRGAPHEARWWLAVLTVALVAPFTTGSAAAQEPLGLTFIGGIAYEPGGPGAALVDELIMAGYADHMPASCQFPGCEPPDHPFYFDEGLNVAALVGVRYRFTAPLSVELLASNGQRGHAEGYSSRARDYVVVAYSSLLLATTVGGHVGPLRVEAGPVFNSTRWEATHNSSRQKRGRTAAVGGTLGVTGSVRLSDALFSLKVGMRGFPGTDLRPAIQVPLEPDYHSFFIGVTAIPTGD